MELEHLVGETWDSHIIQSSRVLQGEVEIMFNKMQEAEARGVDTPQATSVGPTLDVAGLPRVQPRENVPIQFDVTNVGLITPQQLGYGTWTSSGQRAESEIYIGSPPGSAMGNAQRQSLSYGYGTDWVNGVMDQTNIRSLSQRGVTARRRLLQGSNRLDPLREMSDTDEPEEIVFNRVRASTPIRNQPNQNTGV